MTENFLIFIFSLILVIRGATWATKYSAKLAENFRLSKYVIGFIIVAFVSIIPETLISINSAIRGIPEFGLGTLFGSNIADLTLIFAILIIYAGRGIKIESKALKNIRLYPFFLFLPLLFGLNGNYSRVEGTALILAGSLFYYFVFKNCCADKEKRPHDGKDKYKNILLLLLAMAILLAGSHFTVASATNLANALKISPIIIGMLVVGLGTTMPELFYSLKSIKRKDDGLAIGDIMGSVLADATIVVGILAFISPFSFPAKIVYVTGAFMVVASLVLLKFMRSDRTISRREGFMLLAFWAFYAVVEFLINR
ncbi:MAG: sodium:calcium antiporter [Candidatus Portnoybacteria bacterium]|jgi:cation:H+ antiporter|nr:sodium:calcium antiporter [Candidatus Portnoybacteria bacterium]